MVSNRAYFDQPEGAPSVLKHALIDAYLPVFVGKTGLHARERAVYYVDAYAGPGGHTDGAVGSPRLAIQIGKKLERMGRDLRCVFVEREPHYSSALQAVMSSQADGPDWIVLTGDIANNLETVLARTAGAPAFFFLDPFGVGTDHHHVVSMLNRAGRGQTWPPTEVLLNFSASSVWRIGGKLSAGIEDPVTYARLDAACGGDWWRDVFLQACRDNAPAEAARHVALAYKDLTADIGGC
jgi:three-Cys-motif partner protein